MPGDIVGSRVIDAPAESVYRIIADYREGHPRILPRPPFGDLVVESGGYGAGTRIRFEMKIMGQVRTVVGEVTEPEPGRLLVETYPADGTVTRFRVEPTGGAQCRVTIETDLRPRPGLLGWIERRLAGRMLRPVYRRELAQLAAVASEPAPA